MPKGHGSYIAYHDLLSVWPAGVSIVFASRRQARLRDYLARLIPGNGDLEEILEPFKSSNKCVSMFMTLGSQTAMNTQDHRDR
jgi:hypothetical protein